MLRRLVGLETCGRVEWLRMTSILVQAACAEERQADWVKREKAGEEGESGRLSLDEKGKEWKNSRKPIVPSVGMCGELCLPG